MRRNKTTVTMDAVTDGVPGVWTTKEGETRYAPGRLIVKYRDSVTASVARIVNEKKHFKDHTTDRSESLDRLHADQRVRTAKPLFRSETEDVSLGGQSLPEIQEHHKRKLEKAKKYRPGRTARAPGNYSLPDLAHIYVLELSSEVNIVEAAKAFEKDPHVEYAQPDYYAEAQFLPNDPYYGSTGSWGQGYDDLWNLKKIQAEQAWDLSQGNGVVVAVVDTGIDAAHPDIAANLVAGWDFVNNDNNPADDHGHGTHVAGTIAATGNNGVGIIGVAPQSRIMPLKALNNYGSGSMSNLAAAIEYAAMNGADVINNSWGCSYGCPSDPVIEDAVRTAYGLGTVLVFAAGNSSSDIALGPPQNMAESVVVASTDHLDVPSDFSCYGLVDVAAPGGESGLGCSELGDQSILSLRAGITDMYSTCGTTWQGQNVVNGNYYRSRGTSMAAPHVSGLAALVIALHPEFKSEQVRQALRHGSEDLWTSGFDVYTGYGRINAFKALAETPLAALITRRAPATATGVDHVDIYGVAYGPSFMNWTLQYGYGIQPASWTTIATSNSQITGEALLATLDLRSVPDGTNTIRIVATDAFGKSYEDRERFVVDQVTISEPTQKKEHIIRGGNLVTISGTVAPSNFVSYTIKIRDRSGAYLPNTAITLTNGGLQRVVDGVLGTWDTTGLAAAHYFIDVVVNVTPYSPITESIRVIVDPTLHQGWPQSLLPVGTTDAMMSFLDHLLTADINSDGRSELLTAYGSSVTIFDHTGSILPGWPQTIDPNGVGRLILRTPVVGDLDGDGIPEIVAANNSGDVFIWKRDGTLIPGWPKAIGGSYPAVAIADMDSDGINEVIVSDWSGRINVFGTDGIPLPGWPRSLGSQFGPVSVNDVDGDGRNEIVAAGLFTHLLYLLDASGAVRPGWPIQVTPSSNIMSQSYPVLGDIDGDGTLEIVLGALDGLVHAYHADGSPVSGWPQTTQGTPVNPVTLGDIDGDYKLEVVAGNDTVTGTSGYFENYIFAWHGDGTRLNGWPVKYRGAISASFFGYGAAALADVNGDGKADVVVSSDALALYPFALQAFDSSGAMIGGFPKPTVDIGTSEPITPAIADFDGDGWLEMAWIDDRLNIYLWDLEAAASSPLPWPMFKHDARNSGSVVTVPVITYTIAATTGANGSITGPAVVSHGGSARYTITPAVGYHVADVLVEGVSVGAVTSYTFTNVTANHTISASFAIDTYSITATAGANGSISGPATITYGGSAAYSIAAATGYHVADVVVDGVSVGAVTSYNFTNVAANHTISASFAINSYSIAATAGANGSISGPATVDYGNSAVYTISPMEGFRVADVLVDDVSVGAVTIYSFDNVAADHTIIATFAATADLIPISVSGPVNASRSKGISVSSLIKNQGRANAGSFTVAFYLSNDAAITSSDTLLGTKTVTSLNAGITTTVRGSFTVPSGAASGKYYIGVIADSESAVLESNENNNSMAAGNMTNIK
ncbi:MAG: S8 family serine peptidase [Syntrophothermus sp.]